MSVLIKNAILLTMDLSNGPLIKNGSLLIEEDKIVNVSSDGLGKGLRAETVIDANGDLVLPGFINTHLHAESSLGRGLAVDSKSLVEWTRELPYPMRLHMDSEDAYFATLLSSVCAIKCGITSIVFIYNGIPRGNGKNFDAAMKAVEESGLRAVVAKLYQSSEATATDFKGSETSAPFLESDDEIIEEYKRQLAKWHRRSSGLIEIWAGPSIMHSSTPELLAKVHDVATKWDSGMTTHVSVSKATADSYRKHYGKSEIEVAEDMGVLGPKFGAVHCIGVSENDIDILSRTSTSVSHNPTSNMLIAQGIAPIPQMLAKGVNVALGTDGPHCNNRIDMIEAMKDGALLHKVAGLDGSVFGDSSYSVLRMATECGARFMGKEDVGKLKTGYKADVIIVNRHTPQFTPSIDPIAGLVYSSSGEDVRTAIVNGKLVMEDRKLLHLSENAILSKAEQRAKGLIGRMRKAGVRIPCPRYLW